MEHRPSTPLFDPDAQAALHAELAVAARTPALRPLVLDPQPDLGPRFVGYWRQLSALPRRTRRSLQRRWKRSLAAIALLMALGQVPALAATIAVDGSTCTLVDAITAANTDAQTGGCTAGNGADTLVLAAGSTHTLTTVEYGSRSGATGLPLVTSTITIAGNNSTIERGSEQSLFRLMAVSATGDLTLQGLTLRGGYSGFGESDDDSVGGGGGVFNRGTLTISNSTVSGNVSNNDFGHGGGGVFNDKGTVTITHSTVSGNEALSRPQFGETLTCGFGGGVFSRGTLTISNSTICSNLAGFNPCVGDASGGGVLNAGILTLIDSTVTGNTVIGGSCRRHYYYCAYSVSGGGVASSGT